MCYRVQIKARTKAVAHRFGAQFESNVPEIFDSEVNGFAHENYPIITNENSKSIVEYSWGLIPTWSKNADIQKLILNAKAETLEDKPSFKNMISQRCIVIVTGFYE